MFNSALLSCSFDDGHPGEESLPESESTAGPLGMLLAFVDKRMRLSRPTEDTRGAGHTRRVDADAARAWRGIVLEREHSNLFALLPILGLLWLEFYE